MFVAEIINAESRKRKITCSSCGIAYSARDYQLLYKSKKIIYFKYDKKIFCHECLYKKIKGIAAGQKMSFILMDEKHEFRCLFEPEDDFDSDDTPFSDLF